MCPREHNMARGLYLSALVIVVLAIAQGDCQQCQQNLVLPGFNIQEQPAAINYDISACVECNLESYTILVAGSGLQAEPLTNSTTGVTIVPPSGSTPRYTLMMPDPRTVLSLTAATIIACNSESLRFTELVFGTPILNPNGTINVIEGTNASLSCSTSPDTSATSINAKWTFGSTQLASSTDSVTYSYSNIMRNESGDYNCTLTHNIGNVPYVVTRNAVVNINVQYPPEVTLDTTAIVRQMGGTVMLQCMFDGNPTPTITWWFNGTMLNTSPSRFTTSVAGNVSTLTVTSLVGDDTGSYQCRGENGIGSVTTSDMVSLTVQVRPDPVSNLQNTTQTNTTISLTWALGFDGRESIDSVTVTYAAVSNNDGASEGTAPLGASATAHMLTGLQPLTNYNVCVIATNNVGGSIPECITVETDPVVPDQPTNVVVTPLSSTQLRVTWMTPMRNAFTQTAFQMSRIEYSTSSDFPSAVQMGNVLASVTTFDTTNNLTKGTIYYFRVSVMNSAGFGPVSDIMSARTNVDAPTPVPVLNLTPYPNSICVTWTVPTDNGGQDINRYSVKWASVTSSDDGSTPSNTTSDAVVGEFTNTTVLPPRTNHLITSLASTTTYIVDVSAGNMEAGLGMSIRKNTTTGAAIPQHASSVLSYSNLTAISVRLQWSAVVPVTNYIVEYRPSTQPSWSDARRQPPTITTTSQLQGLEAEEEYVARVIILNNCDQQVTPEVTFTTDKLAVVVPGAGEGRTVMVGVNNVTLRCMLDSGGDAPDVMWRREGGPLPDNVLGVNESTLVILNPQPEDTGNYTCVSRGVATSTLALIVQDVVSVSSGLELWVIIVIAVAASLSILLFLVVLIVVICVCCRRKDSSPKGPAYHMQLQKKTSSSGGWIDEGAGGFVPSTMQSGTYKPTIDDEVDAPIVRGRTHTQDAYTAATFTRKDEISGTNHMSDV